MSHLFSPYQLGQLSLANRIVIPPMSQYSVPNDGVMGAWHSQHIGRLALSGAGLVILEAHAVEAAGRISAHDPGLWNDQQEAALREAMEGVRTYSTTPIGLQLNHAGRKASTNRPWKDGGRSLTDDEGGWETFAPSAIPYKTGWRTPTALDEAGLKRITDGFVASAMRADRIGFDLLELHAAHGYLLTEFLSPLTNQRDDAYGGSAENRQRFPLEIARALRTVWPSTKPIGVRFNASDWVPNGLELEEAQKFALQLHDIGFDYLHVSSGANDPTATTPGNEPAFQVHLAEAIKAAVPSATVIGVGVIYDALQAESVLANGTLDLLAVGRAFLDDANWPIHAAIALGEPAPWPKPYDRFGVDGWPTHKLVQA